MGLFEHHHSGNNSNSDQCPVPSDSETLSKHGTAHFPMYIVAAICAGIALVSSVSLVTLHLTRYRRPREQRQIVKILFTPFVFALISWAELADYRVAPYIDPIGEVYESICLCAIFLLFIQFAVPNATFGPEMFDGMHQATETRLSKDTGNWPKLTWLLVFQFPITELVAVIILEATLATGVYCASSLKPRFGHLWVMIIRSVGVVVCVMAILRFYQRMKTLMKARRAPAKLWCFKGIVFLRFIQSWIFNILFNHDIVKPSSQFSYGDLTYGIPNVLLAAEMVLFSLSFWYAYSAAEYSSKAKPGTSTLNFVHAIADSLNPSDILHGIVRGIKLLLSGVLQSSESRDAESGGQYGLVQTGHRYGPGSSVMHNNGYNSEDNGFGGYSQGMYQSPPSFDAVAEDDPTKRRLVADHRSARSRSPGDR